LVRFPLPFKQAASPILPPLTIRRDPEIQTASNLSAIAVFYPAACILYGDLIPEAAGLGHDGVRSATYSQNIATLFNKVPNAYTVQHSLIWFVLDGVYWVIAQFSATFADALNVNHIPGLAPQGWRANATIAIASYWVVNSICLVASIFCWAKILERLAITGAVAVLSYFMLFISVGNLKMPSFYVIIGDLPMLLFGVGAIYLYLANRRAWLMGFGIVSGFIRPGLPEMAALLLMFPHVTHGTRSSSGGHLGYVAAGLGGAILAAGVAYYINDPRHLQDSVAVRLLSGAIACAYVTVGLYFLFRRVRLDDVIPQIRHVLSALAVIAGVAIPLWLFASSTDLNYLEFFKRGIHTGSAFPGISLVAHTVYFGPGLLLVILLWPKVADAARELGPGFVAMLGLGVCLSIFSESRAITPYIPAFILALTLALARMEHLRQWGFVACAVLCVLFSKVWLQMAMTDQFFDGPGVLPLQRYFMNFGPWITPQSYLWQGMAILAASAVLIVWLFGYHTHPVKATV
jgi:hypothetical protein